MPTNGPDGRQAYSPVEAYEAVGRHHYRGKWAARFLPGGPLPHPPTAKRIVDAGGENADAILEFGHPDTDEYKRTQVDRIRTKTVLDRLFTALLWGKADAWCRQARTGEWHLICVSEWEEGMSASSAVLRVLEGYYLHGRSGPATLLIEKGGLDRWVAGNPVEPVDPNIPFSAERLPGRPPEDWDAIWQEISRKEEIGNLPEFNRGWRSRFCAELSGWYAENVDGSSDPLKPKTIMKKLKAELDRLEEEHG
jgi:hypothetical protein